MLKPQRRMIPYSPQSYLLAGLMITALVCPALAQTQAAMNAQARAEFQKADAQLNKTYESLMSALPDAESKRKLRESQRAWITFRDAEVAFAADEVRGGSMVPTIRYTTMTEITQQRIKQVKAGFPK